MTTRSEGGRPWRSIVAELPGPYRPTPMVRGSPAWACPVFLLVGVAGTTPACEAPPASADDPRPPAEAAWIDAEPPHCSEPLVEGIAGEPGAFATAHFTLHLPGVTEDEARALAVLAEAAWPALSDFFGSEPEPDPLEVWLDADEAAFLARLAAAGVEVPPGIGGWYEPGLGSFLHVQPSPWYTRVLFLHEVVHQFHDAVSVDADRPFWYVEGLAEALARHHWDGRCLRLRATPLLSWEDLPAKALQALDEDGPCVGCRIADPDFEDRPVSMEIVRFLASDPERRSAFFSWREDVDAGRIAADDALVFEERFGVLDDRFEAFVAADQEPARPLFTEWMPIDALSVTGFAEFSSGAALKDLAQWGGAGIESTWSGTGEVGVVYGHDDRDGSVELALVDAAGAVSRFAVVAGEVHWDTVATVDAPSAAGSGLLVMVEVASRENGAVELAIDGRRVLVPQDLPSAWGPALYGAMATFEILP